MKRTFTFLLALLMLLSMVPTTALAAQTEEAPAASAAAVTSESTVEAPEPTPQPEPAVPVLDEKAAQTRASGSAAGSSDIVATVPVQYYSKKGVTPDPTVMAGTTKLKKGTHYTLSYENNDAVGTDATVTITGLGTYADYKQTLPMAILKRDIAEGYAVVHNAQSFTGSPVTPEPEVYVAGSYLKAGEDYVVYYENNINAGTAKFRVVGIGNYCGTCAGTFQIETKTHYTELTGEYNGNVSGTLDMDKYSYAELVIAPGSHKFEIDHAINNTVYDHVASYQLYRIVDDSYELVKSLETEEGLHDKTAFRYDFSDIYEGETESGGALYMLSFSYVDVRGRVYSGMRTLVIPAKLPDATFLQPEMVDVQDYRHGYATAYGLNGNLGSISWQSSDPSIVSVSDGVFTMHKLGLVTLTAKSGNIEGSIQITVMAEDLSQGELFAFDVSTGKPTVIYDGRILEEGTDYTLETAQTGGLWEVAVTGTGVFTGQLIRYFDADGNATSHSHGFPSTCDAKCVRCDLQREPETEHRYETHKDEETHWQVCVYCSHKKDEAPHIYQNGNSKLCTQCGEIPAAAETPEYEYPPSDTDGELLTQLPIPGSTIVISFNTIAMGADRAGIGLAPIPGKAEGDQLAITDGMAQLEVRSEGAQYLFLLDGKYLTCGILGTTLYFSDTPTAHSRWHITPAENNNWKLINEGTQLALSFLYSFAPYPEEDNPVCSLQLYRVGDLPKLPEGIPRLAAPVMLTPEQSTIDGSCLIEWVSVPYADAYEVYRSTSKTGSYTKVATVTTTFYQQELTASKTYYYKVKAVYTPDTTKNSNFSTVVSFVARLAAPTVSMTLNDESGKMVFTWEAVPGASKYEIYRRERNGSYEKVGTTTKLSYTDTKASPYVTYYYAFRSISSTISYSSDFSAEYQCMHHSPRPKVTIKLDSKDSCPVVSWEPIAGIRSYQLQYRYPGMTEFKNDSRYAGTSMKFINAPGDSLCEYRVYPIGEEYVPLEETPYTEVSIITGIGTPVFTGWRGSNGELKFEWEAVSGAVKYELYRSTKEKKGYTLCATITDGLTYADTTVPVGKTYYYKLVAVGNLSRSKDSRICRLTPCCATPTLTVEHAESGKPMLSWEKISGAKKYTVYYRTTQYGGLKKLGTTTKTTYIHTKAKAGTTYYYRVLANASSSGSNSNYSNAVTCSVICGTPSVTAKVDAVSGKPSLSWKKVDAAVKYRILRQLPGEEDFTVIAEQTALTFKDETAPIDTLCKYMVQTLGKTEDLHGGLTKVLEIASGIARPSLKTGLDAQGKPQLTWEPIEGAVKYEIYRSTKSTKSYKLLTTVEVPGYTDDSVAPGKTYYYKVVAIGQVSKSAETAYVKLTGKCATPEIAAEVDYFSGRPVVSWQKVTGAKKYTVYRATSETGKYKKLGTTTKLTYTDTKATVATTYFYKIVANASSSKYSSGYSNLVSCTPTCAVPAIKVATAAATGKPVLSWKKVTGAVVYEIWLEQAGAMELLTSTTKLTFTDESIVPGETKIYWVYAVDALGRKAGEWAVATATCPQPKPTGKAGETGKPELTWEAVEGATRYVIYRSTSKSKGYKAIDETDSLTFTDTTAKKGKTYYYKVAALCEETESAQSAYVKIKSK